MCSSEARMGSQSCWQNALKEEKVGNKDAQQDVVEEQVRWRHWHQAGSVD